jgi:hypothetical protein
MKAKSNKAGKGGKNDKRKKYLVDADIHCEYCDGVTKEGVRKDSEGKEIVLMERCDKCKWQVNFYSGPRRVAYGSPW